MTLQLDDKSDNLQHDVGEVPSSFHSHRHQLLQQEKRCQVENLFSDFNLKIVSAARYVAKTAEERCKALWYHTRQVPPMFVSILPARQPRPGFEIYKGSLPQIHAAGIWALPF